MTWGNAAAGWHRLVWRARLAWARHQERHASWCLKTALVTENECPDDDEIQRLAAAAVFATVNRRRTELSAP